MPLPVLTLGVTGLSASDLGFRFWEVDEDGAARNTTVEAALTLTSLGSGDYRVNGLPEAVGSGTWLTLTWSYAGVDGFYTYPTPQSAAPPYLVIPVRQTGLGVSDLGLAAYKDGVLQGHSLAATELVAGAGDYLVSGWPTSSNVGAWLLVWRRGGISHWFAWSVGSSSSSAFMADLADCFADTILAIPGSLDYTGAWTPSGTVLSIAARLEGENRLVRDPDGREVASSVQAILAGAFDLSTDGHRYTLPSRFAPASSLRAIGVERVSDEAGALYEELVFP